MFLRVSITDIHYKVIINFKDAAHKKTDCLDSTVPLDMREKLFRKVINPHCIKIIEVKLIETAVLPDCAIQLDKTKMYINYC